MSVPVRLLAAQVAIVDANAGIAALTIKGNTAQNEMNVQFSEVELRLAEYRTHHAGVGGPNPPIDIFFINQMVSIICRPF